MDQRANPAQPSRASYPEPVRGYAARNTVRALQQLAFADRSTSGLADILQVSARHTRRLLQRLELEGFVTQEKRGPCLRYRATLRLAALGRQMLDHAPLTQAAAPCVVRLAQETACAAHLWIPGYESSVVCAVHADGRPGCPTVSVLCDVASAPSSAAGNLLSPGRAEIRSSCYVHQAEEPTFAAAVLERGSVVGALGVSGDGAFDASCAVVTAAAQVSADLGSRP